jgi:hypothetical protein
MLFEQKSRRKSSVEIEFYPYKSLTTPYFLIRFPQRFLALAITTYVCEVRTAFSGVSLFLPQGGLFLL